MLKNLTHCSFIAICLVFCLTACIKDVDFQQAEDLSISPTLELSIIHFEEPAGTFVDDNGVELIAVTDSVYVDIFSDEFVVDNLIKADFQFEATNTINRAYRADVEFYNDDFEMQHNFSFSVPASPNNQEIVVEYVEVFEGPELEALKATTNLVLTFTLLPSNDGSILQDSSPGNLKLRSRASFYLEINTSE
jgi:hypothetical protein